MENIFWKIFYYIPRDAFGAFGTCRLELCLLSENSCFVIVCFKIDLNLQHIVYFVKVLCIQLFTVEMYYMLSTKVLSN